MKAARLIVKSLLDPAKFLTSSSDPAILIVEFINTKNIPTQANHFANVTTDVSISINFRNM